MTKPTRRDWWRLVEEHLEEAARDGSEAPDAPIDDPWADGPEPPGLTPDQRALLEGVDDQPGVPRVTHADPRHADQPPHPRLAPRVADERPDDNAP